MPKDPDGAQHLLIGGDRLTEANCRNAQWGFSDADTEEERMEGMYFKFEDWHAIRVLFEVRNHVKKYLHYLVISNIFVYGFYISTLVYMFGCVCMFT